MTTKKKGATSGRNTVMTPELVEKLERAFANSFTDEEACLFVGIDKQTLYNYCEKYPNFSTKKEALKKKPNLKAKMNILEGLNSKDPIVNLPTSKWWAERKMKEEFSLRIENINQDTKELELYDNERMREIKARAKGEFKTTTD